MVECLLVELRTMNFGCFFAEIHKTIQVQAAELLLYTLYPRSLLLSSKFSSKPDLMTLMLLFYARVPPWYAYLLSEDYQTQVASRIQA